MKLVETICPFCQVRHPLTAGIDHDDAPSDGCASICVKCEQVSIFDFQRRGNLRIPTLKEQDEITRDADIQKARLMLRFTR